MKTYAAGVLVRLPLILLFASLGLAACNAETSPDTPAPSRLVPLELQVRNSGLPGGYVRLAIDGQPDTGRWHRFGMAEFICATCPEPFGGSGTGYEITILDESCGLRAQYRVDGGAFLVEIDPGPTLKIVPAPPLGDWMPEDSPPADPGVIPCDAD